MINSNYILITGAFGGMGKSTAEYLAKKGYNLILVDIRIDEEFHGELKNINDNIEIFKIDISNSLEVKKISESLETHSKKLQGIVHLAGITRDKSLKKMSDEEWQQVINVNLTGTFNILKELSKHFDTYGGSIVLVGSTAAHYGNFGQINYVASKGGIEAMTKTAARELAKYHIRVNCIVPGLIETEMSKKIPIEQLNAMIASIPLGRIGKPFDVAKLIGFLISDDSEYITGASIKIDGGLKM